ncbi:MAG: DUF5655 domain-containing protein [Thaumarchaeota archaeon]|nr:DUF5655 domain-containing protein [Nitrososphaerota archaeon]
MLYKLKQDGTSATFVRLTPTTMTAEKLPEKVMEHWLADNPHAALPDEERVLVISQERAFENLVDILAIDEEGSLIVIEVKRSQTHRDVIAQALEYASDVADWDYQKLNLKAAEYFAAKKLPYDSLLSAFQETFGVGPTDFSESQYNQRQRIYMVAETIEPKIERATRWLLTRGVPIGYIVYRCYRAEDGDFFLEFIEVVRPADGRPRPPLSVSVPTEDEIMQRTIPSIRNLYLELRRRAASFGDDVQIGPTRLYIKFSAGNNFAEIHPLRNSIRIYVRPEGFDIPENQSQTVKGITVTRVADKNLWTLNHWFTISEDIELDAAEQLLRQSYETVKGRLSRTISRSAREP